MSKEILEPTEPMQAEEVISATVQAILADEDPIFIADDIWDNFISQNRPETAQILSLLDLPPETITDALIQIQIQGMESLKLKAPAFLSELQGIVKTRLADLANGKTNISK